MPFNPRINDKPHSIRVCPRRVRGLHGGGGQTLIDSGREDAEGSRALPPAGAHRQWLRSPLAPTLEHGETLRHHHAASIALVALILIADPAVFVSAATTITIPFVSGTVMTREDGEVVGEPVGDHLEPVGAAAGRGGQQVASAHPGAPGPR